MASHSLVVEGTSDTSPHVILHPLVLVTISDHGTRATLKSRQPVFGAILGQNNGKELTLEIAFECGTDSLTFENGAPVLNVDWFSNMIQHHIETHPSLALVGWYTFGEEPKPWHSSVQAQLEKDFECDSPAFLLLHDDQLRESSGPSTGKLPFTIYETFTRTHRTEDGEDMDIEYTDRSQSFRYRPLSYTLDTSPDEAIALRDVVEHATVANLSGGVTAKQPQAQTQAQSQEQPQSPSKTKSKGKTKIKDIVSSQEPVLSSEPINLDLLTPEEEELITALTAKSNAIKMLKSRLAVISAYIQSQVPPTSSPSYLSDASVPIDPSSTPKSVDLEILRTASALASQLKLVPPSDFLAFERETLQTKTDVELVTLLSTLTRRANDAVMLGKRWSVLESGKRREKQGRGDALSTALTEQLKSSALN